jgi:hypothetical protein
MEPPPKFLVRMGIWIVAVLVVATLITAMLKILLSDWRFYIAMSMVSITSYLATRERRGQERGAGLERTPHDPSPRHEPRERWSG